MKKQTILTLPLLTLLILTLSACQVLPFIGPSRGSGNLVTQTRTVSGFDAVQLDGAGRLIIEQGPVVSLEIQAEDNIIDHITSQVEDNTLVLSYDAPGLRRLVVPTRPIIFNLTVPDLSSLLLNGAADIQLQSLETDSLSIEINGAGNVVIQSLTAQTLNIQLSGTGSLTISGTVTEQVINIDGAGNYQAGDLQTNATDIKISGLGNATVWATETLQVSIEGSGNVSFYGSPRVTQTITGLGQVRDLGEK